MENYKKVIGHTQYIVSESGIVKRVEGIKEAERILIQSFRKVKGKEYPNGYMYVTLLTKNDFNIYNKPIDYPCYSGVSVHRLVAAAFVENPNNYPEVNHIDSNKLNNHYTNLEWVTKSQNIQHSYDNGRVTKKGIESHRYGKKASLETKNKQRISKLGDKHPKFKGVYYVFYKPYNSSTEAYKATNICSRTIIRRCKKGKPGTDYYFVPK